MKTLESKDKNQSTTIWSYILNDSIILYVKITMGEYTLAWKMIEMLVTEISEQNIRSAVKALELAFQEEGVSAADGLLDECKKQIMAHKR